MHKREVIPLDIQYLLVSMKANIQPGEKKLNPNDSNPCDYCGCEILFYEESKWIGNKWFHSDCQEIKDMLGPVKNKEDNSRFLVIKSVTVLYG